MNLKKTFLLFILPILMILNLTSCSQEKPITIGFSAGLTGSTSELGVSGRNGLLMAVEEINAVGGVNGHQVDVIIKDDQNDPQIALDVDQELYESGVSFIIGHMTSNMAELALPYINDKNILMISPTMSSYQLVNQDDHLITVVSANDYEAAFIAESMSRKGGEKKVAVIYESQNKAYTGTIKDFLASELSKNGGQIITEESFKSGDNPAYFEIAKRVMDTEPDSIVILASSFDSAMFCQQFYKSGNQIPIYLAAWSMNNDLIFQGGESVEGVNLTSLIDYDSQKPEYQTFREAYLKKYGTEPPFSASYSYEAAMILFETMKVTNSLEPEKIKAAIIKKGTFQGLQAEININQFGDGSRKLYHYVIKDGQFEKVD